MRSIEELFDLALPKWPQMIVTGKSISIPDALEIIRRTDSFFDGCWEGNNKQFNAIAKAAVHFPDNDDVDFDDYWNRRQLWMEKWGYINCEYVLNSWVSCAFVNGPHGWCHPDGSIGFIDNVGKWPTVEEIYNDWMKLATAFVFLELEVTLMSGEGCEDGITPVVSFLIRNGEIDVIDPQERNIHNEFDRKILQKLTDEEWSNYFHFRLLDNSLENALPIEQIKSWGTQFVQKTGYPY